MEDFNELSKSAIYKIQPTNNQHITLTRPQTHFISGSFIGVWHFNEPILITNKILQKREFGLVCLIYRQDITISLSLIHKKIPEREFLILVIISLFRV